MVGQPENNCSKICKWFRIVFLEVFYSTFVALSLLDGAAAAAGGGDTAEAGAAAVPVCVIGTTRSASWIDLRDAVIVNTPSDDSVDCTSLGLVFAMEMKTNNVCIGHFMDLSQFKNAMENLRGNVYLRVNCREMKLKTAKWKQCYCEFLHFILAKKKWNSLKKAYPCSSAFSSCFPSTTTNFSVVLTVISLGVNCCTSKITWNLSLSTFNVEPDP